MRERDRALEGLRALHADVDARATALAERHAVRLQCRAGCAGCCVDELTVFEVEAERIRAEHPELLRDGVPHDVGACAFLDAEGRCRIYSARPYVCRTQGLPLRWLEEGESPEGGGPGEIVERRDICTLNEEGPSILSLDAEDCWSLGPVEERLGALQERFGGSAPRRLALRALFRRRASS